MDRIDLHVEVIPVPFRELSALTTSETSKTIRERVIRARNVQEQRFRGSQGIHCNAQIPSKKLHAICTISEEGHVLLKFVRDHFISPGDNPSGHPCGNLANFFNSSHEISLGYMNP